MTRRRRLRLRGVPLLLLLLLHLVVPAVRLRGDGAAPQRLLLGSGDPTERRPLRVVRHDGAFKSNPGAAL
jgi:hypothetical protein